MFLLQAEVQKRPCCLLQASAQSQASAAHAMRRFARRECAADPEASLETSLHPPLTLPRQPRDQPPVLERLLARQIGGGPRPAAAVAQPAAVQGDSAAPAAVKAEPAAAQRQGAEVQPAAGAHAEENSTAVAPVEQQPAEDLYGDLDLRARDSAIAGSTAPVALRQPPSQPVGRDPQQRAGVGQASTTQHAVQQAGAAGSTAGSVVDEQQADTAAAADLKAILSNPAALQALLKDPAQLQRLLEKHPALISILKTTLGRK